jgi:quinoprotein glucose dehydrogenase
LGIASAATGLRRVVADAEQPAAARADALQVLATLDRASSANDAREALRSDRPELRAAARRVLLQVDPDAARDSLSAVLVDGTVAERRDALEALGKVKHESGDQLLAKSLDALLAGKMPTELHFDLLEAARQRSAAEVRQRLERWEAQRPKKESDPLAEYRELLHGGDAERGSEIFFERTQVSCVRCHRIANRGGEVGPDLTNIGKDKTREYLLEAIVDPNRTIARGFESVTILDSDGRVHVGVLKSENDRSLQLVTAEATVVNISKDAIEERAPAKSPMPEDVSKQLSPRDLRDLVEFLARRGK